MRKKKNIAGPPAGFWVRAAAQVLDATLIGAICLFLSIVMAVILSDPGSMVSTSSVIFAIYLIVPCLYFTIATARWGKTLGKRVFNLRVARMDGQPLSYPLSLWRWVSYFFSAAFLGLGFVLAAVHPGKRAYHDLASGTKVVQVGPPSQTLLIIMLVVVPFVGVSILGMTAAIAIPKFAQILEHSREGATKGNLGFLKTAVTIYRTDHGKPPQDLEKDLVGKYIDMLPPVKATGGFIKKAKSPAGYKVTLAEPGKVPTTSGEGWLYDSSNGRVYVNSTVKDSKGIPYSFYGAE